MWRRLHVQLQVRHSNYPGCLHTLELYLYTCFIHLLDSRGRVWIGGFCNDANNPLTPSPQLSNGDALLVAPPLLGRLVTLDNAEGSRLACSWSPCLDQSIHRRPTPEPIESPASLPLNISGGHPVALCASSEGDHLWCADSLGRLFVFS